MNRDGGLRPMFRQRLPHFMWVVVETPISGGGVPDHWWCCRGVSGWNEYKATHTWRVTFRPEQVGWHLALANHGGRSFIIVRRQKGAADELWIYRGADAALLLRQGLKGIEPLLLCSGGPRGWAWAEIDHLLTNEF